MSRRLVAVFARPRLGRLFRLPRRLPHEVHAERAAALRCELREDFFRRRDRRVAEARRHGDDEDFLGRGERGQHQGDDQQEGCEEREFHGEN